jgi:hypothetical protein
MKEPSNNNLPSQTNDVHCNPQNPVNPDSNQVLGVNIISAPAKKKSMRPRIGKKP